MRHIGRSCHGWLVIIAALLSITGCLEKSESEGLASETVGDPRTLAHTAYTAHTRHTARTRHTSTSRRPSGCHFSHSYKRTGCFDS